MAIKFHKVGFDHAVRLIQAGEVSTFDADWQEEKPTLDEVVYFINHHDMDEYGRWFLGTDGKYPVDAKEHYVYPYGDLKTVQQCGLVDSIKRAKKNGDFEIAKAAEKLLEMLSEGY